MALTITDYGYIIVRREVDVQNEKITYTYAWGPYPTVAILRSYVNTGMDVTRFDSSSPVIIVGPYECRIIAETEREYFVQRIDEDGKLIDGKFY